MAAITNPQGVKFANERFRPFADLWVSLYRTAVELKAEWDNGGLAALIPATADVIVDGSATDGRQPITAQMCRNLLDRIFEFTTDQEAGGNAKLNTVRQVAVNGDPLF